jgi:hypothetical protein
MIDFISKTGNDSFKDSKAFHNFTKDSIDDEISTKQLKRKVRDFKEKFERGKWKYDDKTDFGLLKKIGRGIMVGMKLEKEMKKLLLRKVLRMMLILVCM